MNKQWKIKDIAPADFVSSLSGYHPVIAQLLYNRYRKNQAEAEDFFNPDYAKLHDPFLFKDMARAVERVKRAIKDKEKIIIHGDYDADGVTSAAVLFKAFKALGGDVEVFIPHREWDGYGLNLENAQNFVDRGCRLLITVDCGVTNLKEIDLLNANGVDVIVTDHHEPLPELPKAFAILNAKVPDCGYPFRELTGVGVAFKLVCALLDKSKVPSTKSAPPAEPMAPHGKVNSKSKIQNSNSEIHDSLFIIPDSILPGWEKWLLDLVAIGTVADVAAVIDENRILVKWGLIVLQKTRNVGLQKLLGIIGNKKIDTHTIGFQIAPRLNAAGRMDHANAAFKLLVAEDPIEAEQLALDLHKHNQNRQRVMESSVNQARIQIGAADAAMLFVYHEEWEPGIIGLIAGKLSDEFYKPTIAMTKSQNGIVGSGRSVEGFNITHGLSSAAEFLARFGGHSQACGFTLLNEGVRENFQLLMLQNAEAALKDMTLSPSIDVDAEIKTADIDWPLIEQLEKFEPFGEGNEQPLFLIKNLTLVAFDIVGSTGQHLRLLTKQGNSQLQRMIWFGSAKEFLPLLKVGYNVDVVCEVGGREWNGNRDMEFKIVDLRINI